MSSAGRAVVSNADRTLFEELLGRVGGTVTRFLEELVREPVDARERRHLMTEAGPTDELCVEKGHPVLQRSAVLQGRSSGCHYVHAESRIVPSRLPPAFCRDLETTTQPIGRLLVEEGLRFTRRGLSGPEGGTSSGFGPRPALDEVLSVRRYRLDVDGTPVMVVSEWFLPTLAPYVSRR